MLSHFSENDGQHFLNMPRILYILKANGTKITSDYKFKLTHQIFDAHNHDPC